jgi:iron complex transport system permease protein
LRETTNEKPKRILSGKLKIFLLILSPIIVFLLSLCLGRYYVPVPDVVKILASTFLPIEHSWPKTMETAILVVRLPRLILVALVGASLSVSGASFQGILKNPLVSSDILGVAAGAGFGASIGLLFSLNLIWVQLLAFSFAMLAVGLAYGINSMYRRSSTLVLVLCGIIISSLFSSLVALMKYISDPNTTMASIVFWLLGSFASATGSSIIYFAPPMIIGIIVLLLFRWRINVLSLDDKEAKSLGVNVKRDQGIIIFFASVITASAVCVSGLITWVGLIVPHIARMIFGPNNKKVLPASILIGVSYLILIDDLARTLMPNEISIGILTGTIGAPFFGYLLLRRRVGWS